MDGLLCKPCSLRGLLLLCKQPVDAATLQAKRCRQGLLCTRSPTRAPISCRVLPLMIGWFALNVPSGLSLYYFANTVFTAAQQIYLKKLGGGWGRVDVHLTWWPSASPPRPCYHLTLERADAAFPDPAGANLAKYDLGPIELGKARRTGTVAESVASLDAGDMSAAQNGTAPATTALAVENGTAASLASAAVNASASGDEAEAAGAAVLVGAAAPSINRRCKRRRRELLEAAA